MKKLISVLLSCLLIFSTFQLTTLADMPDIVITSPADGAVLTSLSSVDATVNVAADYVIVRLDGVELDNVVSSSGQVSYELNEPLAIGSHTVDVIAVGEGISAIASSAFQIIVSYDLVKCSAGMESAPTLESPLVANEAGTTLGYTTSHDGTKAFAFNVPAEIAASKKPFLYIGGPFSGHTVLEADMFIRVPLILKLETKNANGAWGSLFHPESFDNPLFNRSGFIQGTTTAYPTNRWFRLKIDADFSTGVGSLYIGEFSNGSVQYTQIFNNMSMGANFINLSQLKFEFNNLAYYNSFDDNKFLGFDNIRITQTKTVTGLSSVSSAGTPVAAGSSSVALKGASQFKPTDFSPYLSAYADGEELGITSATADGDTLSINFAKPLSAQKNVKIVLSEDIKVETDKTLGVSAEFTFATSAPSVCIGSVSAQSGGVSIYSPQQIKPNTALDCRFHLSNESGTAKPVILIAALYKRDEMTTFAYVPHEIPVGDSTKDVTLNLPSGFNTADYSIELFSVDSFASSIPLSKMWGIGK